ncbi:hypothetical protein BH18THE2_BH18THE2_41770 [soil metagenome]
MMQLITRDFNIATHYDAFSPSNLPKKQDTMTRNRTEEHQELSLFTKRILVVDDDPDITLTFKKGLEAENEKSNNIFLEVNAYNNPLVALSEFKPHFYDLLLVDINMPKMDGFEFAAKIVEQDINVKVCFVSAAEINTQALKEQYQTLSIGCFIKKPVSLDNLVRRVRAELE